jgi:Dullard-like phosphatase family protein
MVFSKKVFLPKTEKKKTVILDLDETMIHSDFTSKYENHDHLITFVSDGEEFSVAIFIRPGLNDFLEKLSEKFEVVVFTASVKEYADAVLNYLDPENKYFKNRFYRDSCINISNKVYMKDLRIFNRNLENLIMVDNSIYCFANQLSNGVLINSFYNDKNDNQLSNLQCYLLNYLYDASDIRVTNEQIFNFSGILHELE